MADVRITVTRNGSYHVEGTVALVDHKGNEIPYEGDDFWLCRCGGSENKPFCDGTHRKIGFKGTITAPIRIAGEKAVEGDPTP